jgi:putative ABC transport system ATP-binding protein
MATANSIISIRKLCVTYFPGKSNEVQALKDVSLDIHPGEFIIFFGPSGCGKSTLLYAISGLERKIQGTVIVQNQNLATIKGNRREAFHQRIIGMIFQAFYLIPSLSVLQNVTLPQMALNERRANREKRGLALLKKFGVFEQRLKLPTELSGGQQQRVAICRSVVNDPDILLADEPVGNLDSKSSEEVMKLLRDLNDRDKKTVILVSHDPSHLHHAHRVFYMRDGQIVRIQTNTPEERMQSPIVTAAARSLTVSLEEWAKTLSPDMLASPEVMSELLRSQEMLTEVLTGMTVRDLGKLEEGMVRLLQGKRTAKHKLFRLLHDPEKDGGLAMEKRKTERLLKQLSAFVQEIHRLRRIDRRAKRKNPPRNLISPVVREMRRFLLKQSQFTVQKRSVLVTIDHIIGERLGHTFDGNDTYRELSKPVRKGGAGMRITKARLFAKKLESLILLRGETPMQSPAPEDATNNEKTDEKPPAKTPTVRDRSVTIPSPKITHRLRMRSRREKL